MRKYLSVAAILAAAWAGYYFLYPKAVLARYTQDVLDEVSRAVASKDRAVVGETLKKYMTDDAQIHLEVRMFSITQPEGGKPEAQDFDRTVFLNFIDNILYSLTDYNYEPMLQQFDLSTDHKSAAVTFNSKEWADGKSYFAGTPVNMRFSSDTQCTGHVIFENKKPLLDKADCAMQLRAIPKPEDMYKLQTNPAALIQLLH